MGYADHELPIGTVAVLGPGRVGSVLAAALAAHGHTVTAAAGGSDPSRARFATRFPGARTSADPADAVADSDLVLVATPDDAVEPTVDRLAAADAWREGQRVVHVAGSLGLAALHRAALCGAKVAACHPAQTVPSADADPTVLAGAAWAVTAHANDRGWARDLVVQTGGVPYDVREERRVLYHAALVVASNAAGAVVSVARQLLRAAAVDDPAAFLAPLVHASVDNVLADGAAAITGPVVRGDAGTVARHLAALDADVPTLADAYRALATVILGQVRIGMEADRADAIAAALERES